jgi:hypothetical protein
MSKQKGPKPIMMADIREAFFPNACKENRGDGRTDNRVILEAFAEGRIIGVPTRWRKCKKNGVQTRVVADFKITRAEWARLHREGIREPIDEESVVMV